MGSEKFNRPLRLPYGVDAPTVPILRKQLAEGHEDDSGDDRTSIDFAYYSRQGLPVPSQEWVNKTVINNITRRTYICQNDGHRTSEPVATWESLRNYMTSGDADLTIIHHQFPQAESTNEGDYYYDTYNNTFYKVRQHTTGHFDFQHVGGAEALREVCHAYFSANEGGELPGNDDTHVVYLGTGHDDAGVTNINLPQHNVDLDTRYFVYFNFISDQFEILTDYTPAGGFLDHYGWFPVKAEALNPILRPTAGKFPSANEQLFLTNAVLLDDNGHGYGVKSVLHPGEEEHAAFARFRSSPSDSGSTRGRENPLAWASGTAYRVGDRVDSNGAVYVCVQDHTSTSSGATGDPDDSNFGFTNYWDDTQSYLTVPNRSHFRGVYSRSSDVSNPQVGNWIAVPHIASGQMAFQRYSHTGGPLFGASGWFTYNPYPRVLGAFQSEADAIRSIHSFDPSSRTIALINGQLRELTYFVEHTADTHTYEWVPSRPTGNPVAVFYGAAMTAADGRWQETAAGNKEDESSDRLLRWHETARESYFHGNALNFEFHAPDDVSGEDATITASDILFSPEPGLYHVELGAAGSGGPVGAVLGLYQVMSGTSDDLARALVTPGQANPSSNIFGEPDIEVAAVARRRFLQVNDGDVFLGVFSALNANTSQYMVWEKLD